MHLFPSKTVGPVVAFALFLGTFSPVPAEDTEWSAEAHEAVRDAEYRLTWQGQPTIEGLQAAWHAPNRAQGFRTYFTEAGPSVTRRLKTETRGWTFGL